ncbi:MAG: DUF4142 domain-containing protein [Myxococcaceae bacterium]|nr:DUF4142 domain-containing protein [Myxococcaceae bacterium]
MVRRLTPPVVLLFAFGALADERSPVSKCVQTLHTANRQRIAWSALPGQRSEQEVVRELGFQLSADHSLIDQALMQYAGSNEILLEDEALPDEPMKNLDGRQFDSVFLRTVDRHSALMLRSADACLRLTAEPQLRRVLNKTIATYREHQRAVERAYRELLPAT